ncbi:unnamed protein product [Rhizoctonia solani]|uniref:Uncharacterized protein n=2 Tax=Rhizoctonia solani TaxID=456999 RepID=A0A8H2X805_9AGAM|nr:hypothetical protein RSOL_033580 [Rhizoctonia solani AG-3 Rhs1AP]CAE6337666.1 unnamed protein product [Rhizoctonia solani]CAE6416032.1 unnamed protein product [Rhizoctonia solani]
MPIVISNEPHSLYPRKGGGRGGGGGGGKGGKGAKGSTGSRGGKSISGLSGKTASSGSRGGGVVTTIPSGSRFAGRQAGGATRDNVYGGSYYGSGYPYGSYGSTWVGGRPFPYYYWPVYVGPHQYYGSSEYGPANSTERPGGPMYTISVYTTDPKYNTTDVYRILGDQDSVGTVLAALQSNCSVVGGTMFDYDPTSNDLAHSLPRIESVVQWYRSSSFALSLDGYNNSASAITPAALSNNTQQLITALLPSTPLPSNLDRAFLDCVNYTTATSLPLIDAGFSHLPPVNGLGLLFVLWTTLIMLRQSFF